MLAARGRHWFVVTVFWVAFIGPMLLWAYLSARREINAVLRRLQNALLRNQARVIRIQSEELAEIEEEEDEGACYAFQLDSEKIVFISGQDYYPSASFPNSDFSLLQILGREGEIVEELISKQGRKLAPVRTISAVTKSRLKIPDHLQVISGQIESLEKLLDS